MTGELEDGQESVLVADVVLCKVAGKTRCGLKIVSENVDLVQEVLARQIKTKSNEKMKFGVCFAKGYLQASPVSMSTNKRKWWRSYEFEASMSKLPSL